MHTRLAAVPVLLAVVLGAAACSGEEGGSSAGSGGGGMAAQGGPAKAAAPSAAAPSAARGGASVTNGPAVETASTTARIRTVELSVTVHGATRVAAQADRAGDIAVAAGGEVDTDDRNGGRHADATLRLRVPPEQLRGVLMQLRRLGTETARTSSTVDVTEQVADVNARVASARAAIARLRGLYAQAGRVADVLAVEGQLSRREADLESLEAQQRTLARQTQLATVTLSLSTAAAAPVHRPDRYAGVVGGLRRGWDAFLSAARGVGTAVGAMLPFLVVVLALALVARWLGWRVPRRRTTPPVAE